MAIIFNSFYYRNIGLLELFFPEEVERSKREGSLKESSRGPDIYGEAQSP